MFCTNCGQEYNGNFCPNCGSPTTQEQHVQAQPTGALKQQQYQYDKAIKKPKKKHGCLTVIVVIFVIFILLIFLLSCIEVDVEDSDEADTQQEIIVDSDKNEDNAKNKDKSKDLTVGSSFDNDNLKITINDASTNFTDYDDSYGWNTPEDGMKYVMVSFTFKNIGEEDTQYVSIYDFDCYADDSVCEQVYSLDDNDFVNTNLSPGRKVSFKTYYAVPKNSESIELEYKENFWNDKRVLIKIK